MGLKFSIITCTWNSVEYLPMSINSVLSQDYDNIEYIFVDGGSDDGTIELIKSIPRPIKFVTGIRDGISNAMNEGIRLATGDVIAHLHSDDYYVNDRVIGLVAGVFERTGAEWCFGRHMEDVAGQLHREGYVVPRYSYRKLLKANFIPHESTFVRKRAFDQVGFFDTRYRYAMDCDMWLRIGRLFDPVQIDENLGVFRRHAGSLSSNNLLEGFEEDFAVRMKYVDRTPWDFLYHYAHYFVRRQRIKRRLTQTKTEVVHG